MRFLLLLAALAASTRAGTVVHRDLPYADPGDPAHRLDLYAPEGGGRRPVVVWIHGGGWAHGDKSDLQAGARDPVNRKPAGFVGQGFVFVAINYRLFPAADIRQMTADVARAIAWVHRHAAEYGGDGNAIYVMGHSAGAHLAALVCTDAGYLQDQGLSLRILKGCVAVDGDMYYAPLRIQTEASVYEQRSDRLKFPDDGAQREFSPVDHVAPGKGIPPFLLLHVAGHLETGTTLQAEIFAEALREGGIPVRVVPCPGKDHRSLNADLGLAGDPATEAIDSFLGRP